MANNRRDIWQYAALHVDDLFVIGTRYEPELTPWLALLTSRQYGRRTQVTVADCLAGVGHAMWHRTGPNQPGDGLSALIYIVEHATTPMPTAAIRRYGDRWAGAVLSMPSVLTFPSGPVDGRVTLLVTREQHCELVYGEDGRPGELADEGRIRGDTPRLLRDLVAALDITMEKQGL